MGRYEAERREHVLRYGSFLHCPKKSTICSKMARRWETGENCDRDPCILEDPDYIRLQEQIGMKRTEQNEKEAARAKRREETQIRDQRNYIKSVEQTIMDEIHAMEDRARDAYRDNNPRLGDDLLYKSMQKRRELKTWQERKVAT